MQFTFLKTECLKGINDQCDTLNFILMMTSERGRNIFKDKKIEHSKITDKKPLILGIISEIHEVLK